MAANQFPSLLQLQSRELIYLYRNQFTIGRGMQCSLVIANENISRIHCTLFKENDNNWYLKDSSTNGTYLNHILLKGIKSTPLKEGDLIMIGLNEYTYKFSNPASSLFVREVQPPDLMTILATHESVPLAPSQEFLTFAAADEGGPVFICTNAEPLRNNVTDIRQPLSNITSQSKRPRIEQSNESDGVILLDNTNDESVILLDLSSANNETNEPSTSIEVGVLNKPSTSSDDNDAKIIAKENSTQKEKDKENSSLQGSYFNVVEDEFQCSICSEIFIKATTLGCSHTFCSFCIDQWRKAKTICPICRANISSVSPTIVLDNFIEKFFIEKASEEQRNLRKQVLEERSQQTTAKVKQDAPHQSTSAVNRLAAPAPTIELSSDESDSDDDEDDDYGVDFGDPEYEGAYYGGYGRCYACGRRGHWAPNCPYRRRRL